jgi:hypothetical protein
LARIGSQQGFRSRSLGLVLTGGILMVIGGGVGGCQKTALRPDDVRSPYDRYERSRSERAEPYLTDAFGRRTPNLRGRLLDQGE